jgi:phage-related tail protein
MAKKQIATFLGTGKSLSVLGEHCYAYSGIVAIGAVQNTQYSMLDFTTGKKYIRCELQFAPTDAESSNDFQTVIKINGVQVWGELNQETFSRYHDLKQPAIIIIPPNSVVTVTMANVTAASSINWICALTGRLYE